MKWDVTLSSYSEHWNEKLHERRDTLKPISKFDNEKLKLQLTIKIKAKRPELNTEQ